MRASGLAAVGMVAGLLLSACTPDAPTPGPESPGATGGTTASATASPNRAPTSAPASGPGSSPTGAPSPGAPSSASNQPSISAPTALCASTVPSSNPVLRAVRFGRHDTFDRLAFDFCQPAETTFNAAEVKELIADGSGAKVTLQGTRFFALTLKPADAHDTGGRPTVSNSVVDVPGRYMQQYKMIGDFEGVVTYGVGARDVAPTGVGMLTDPVDPRHVIFYFDLGPQRNRGGG